MIRLTAESGHMSDRPQRLFFALCPDQATRRAVKDRMQLLDGLEGEPTGHSAAHDRRGYKKVCEANLHITVAFLGMVTAERQSCIEQAVEQIHQPSFDLELDHFGYWRRSQILWAGCQPAPGALQNLVAELQQAMRDCDIPVEARSFQPHMTLMRGVRRKPADLPVMPPLRWSLDSFSLMVSEQQPGGGVSYQVLRSWLLAD